jgi:hypothetical protein
MQSVIFYSGYGYSKRLCADVTTWFLNKFFPRHNISVEIVHRGLKRECVYGYCDILENSQRPRSFLIELDTHMCQENYIKTLLHELTHLKQWVDGSLRLRYGKMCYCKEPVENYDYCNQPHEIEARIMEVKLYYEYCQERGVPVRQVSHFFPNRLMQTV